MRISDWSSDLCSSDLLEFVDMISEEPGHPVRGSLGPTRLHVVHLVAQNALESGGQFADEFLEEPGDVGLKPAGRLVSASSEEQQHVSVRGHPGEIGRAHV